MEFDFSYIELVYEVIDGYKDLDDIINTKAFLLIKNHAENAFGGHDNILKAIISIQNGCPNKLANYLLLNKQKILNLVDLLKQKQFEFNNILIENVRNIYPNGNFKDITIFFIVGYDAIGYKGNIVCPLDFDLILDDYRELISLLIHELAHIIHSQYCPYMNNISISKETIKNTLNLLIQSEGIAIFSAYNYRNSVGIIKNKEDNITQDYNNTTEKEHFLRQVYKNTMNSLAKGEDMNTILDMYFSSRVDHALGFIIFENMYKKFGINIIRKMATMDNSEFVKLYING